MEFEALRGLSGRRRALNDGRTMARYGSTVAPEVPGAGDSCCNVGCGLGVVTGNGGKLRTGLPLQAVHDGQNFVHELLRLPVLVEGPGASGFVRGR